MWAFALTGPTCRRPFLRIGRNPDRPHLGQAELWAELWAEPWAEPWGRHCPLIDKHNQRTKAKPEVEESGSQSATRNGSGSSPHASSTETAFFVDPNAPTNRSVDLPRIEAAVRTILAAVGEDPDREGLLETPARVARMYAEMFAGIHSDPARHLAKVFVEDYDEIVLVRDISFCSMCEHHLLPFTGRAHIAYLPSGKVVGLSKLARVVEEVSRRPQVQERLTQTVADLVEDELSARGVAVVCEATHSCMTMRGVRKPGSLCVTSAMRGSFRDDPMSRAEVLGLINRDG